MKNYNKKPYDKEYTLEELNSVIKTFQQAKDDGDVYYFTGVLCKHNHLSMRYVSSNRCIKCVFDRIEREREHVRKVQKDYYNKNKEKFIEYRIENLEYYLFISSKNRAKKKNIEFTITQEDIIIPDICPVFGVPLDRSAADRVYSPSIDRFDNDVGYTKDNIRIISTRANKLKNNATLEELKNIVEYLENSKSSVITPEKNFIF